MYHRIIRSLGLLSLACLGGLSAHAQSPVWKVTNGGNTLYLGGTIHVLRAQDFPLPAEFDQAFGASDTLYFETDLARFNDPVFQQGLLAQGRYTDGGTLEKALSPEAWRAVQAYGAKAGVPPAALNQLKPWMVTILISAVEMQKVGVAEEGVDLHYFRQAATKGKATRGLETIDEHLAFLTGLGAGHESEMVLNTLSEISGLSSTLGSMLAAWKAGDLARIDATMIKEVREQYPSVYADLIVKRNRAWLPTLEGLLRSAPTEMVLVGAAHLAGADGLLAELQKRGFKVEQVAAPAARK